MKPALEHCVNCCVPNCCCGAAEYWQYLLVNNGDVVQIDVIQTID